MAFFLTPGIAARRVYPRVVGIDIEYEPHSVTDNDDLSAAHGWAEVDER